MEEVKRRAAFLRWLAARGLAVGAVILALMEFVAWATDWLSFSLTSVVIFGSVWGVLLHVIVMCPAMALASWPSRARYRRYCEKEVLSIDPIEFYVLASLLDGETNGLGISLEVEERTGGDVRLGAGSLYGVLGRLRGRGLVKETGRRRDPRSHDPDFARPYYQLTPQGRALAEREFDRLDREGLVEVPS